MPTVAEIEYIMRLADERKIPELFTIREGSYYFSAQGRINTMDFKNNNKRLKTPINEKGEADHSGNAAVRCVYDDWYWGNDTIKKDTDGKYPFTWGDRAR